MKFGYMTKKVIKLAMINAVNIMCIDNCPQFAAYFLLE